MIIISREGRLAKNTSILVVGTICTKGIMFFMTPLYTVWLSVGDYGTFDLITTYTSLLIPFVTLSVSEALFRFMLDAKSLSQRKTIASTAFAIYCVGGVFVVIVGTIIAIMRYDLASLVLSVIVYVLAEMLYNYAMTILRGLKHLDQYTLGNILFVLGLAIATVVTVYIFNLGLVGILLGYAIGDIIAVVAMAGLSKFHQLVSFASTAFSELRVLLGYSIPVLPNTISWWVINASDRAIISVFLGAEANAVYAIANKLSGLCTTFFSVFHLSWQQSATEALADADRDCYYSSIFSTATRIIASICILVIGVNNLFFDIFFSDAYTEGRYVAPILAFAVLLSVQAQFIGGIYVALKWSKKNGATTLVAAAVNAALNLIFIGELGLYAAALSTLAAYAVLLTLRLIDVRRKIGLRISKDSILAMCLTVCFVAASYISFEGIGILLLCLSVICFVVMNRPLIQKTMHEVHEIIKRKKNSDSKVI